MDDQDKERVMGKTFLDTALVPIHVASSKSAQRFYLSTFLFGTASLFLLTISSVAYTVFYYNYVPQIGIEHTIHLQFGEGHPYGTVPLSSALTTFQPYDITIFLDLPRTPANIAAGNFMLDLSLVSPDASASTAKKLTSSALANDASILVIARSRRPAILSYASPMVNTANILSGLLWVLIGWKKESETLKVSMFEGVEFEKGWRNMPQGARVVIEADEKMQIYELKIKIIARLEGLRWLLYHHRIISFLLFTAVFWTSSMVSALAAWLMLLSYFSPQPKNSQPESESPSPATKPEPSDPEKFDPFSTKDLSDTSVSFPTLGRQAPLHFSGRKEARLKEEEREREAKHEEEEYIGSSAVIQPPSAASAAAAAAEADDEDDDDDEDGFDLGANPGRWRDSGIGTSLDDRTGTEGSRQRRRRGLFSAGDRM